MQEVDSLNEQLGVHDIDDKTDFFLCVCVCMDECENVSHEIVLNTVNSLFFIVEIFSDAHVVRKFVTRILFHYENFPPTKYYLSRIFRTKVRTRE